MVTAPRGSAWDRVADASAMLMIVLVVAAAGLFVASVVALALGAPDVSFVFVRLLAVALVAAVVAGVISFGAWLGP